MKRVAQEAQSHAEFCKYMGRGILVWQCVNNVRQNMRSYGEKRFGLAVWRSKVQ